MTKTTDTSYSDGEYKVVIENLPLNEHGCEVVHVREAIMEFAEKMESLGVKMVRVKLEGEC